MSVKIARTAFAAGTPLAPEIWTQKFSKVAVVRVGLGYMIFGHRDGATPSVGDGGSHLREEPSRVHRRRADRRVSDEWQSR